MQNVSLKKIVAEIDVALAQLSDESGSGEGRDAPKDRTRAALATRKLRRVREDVMGICLPDFEVPSA